MKLGHRAFLFRAAIAALCSLSLRLQRGRSEVKESHPLTVRTVRIA